jgi:hypothetical protein
MQFHCYDSATRPGSGVRMKVLSIIGYTRSGSTLLDSILGQVDGFFSTGELHYLWERGLIEGRRCGCGQALGSCEVWPRVLAMAFDGGTPDPSEVMALQNRVVRTRHTWHLLRGGRGPFFDENAFRSYRDIAGNLYRGIADVTGARVVVDSSKRPSDGALTTLLPGVEHYVVHLVRDPRAVVYSWRRRKQELDSVVGEGMPRQGVASSAFGWLELNAFSELVRRKAGPSRAILLRYEDFIEAPRATVASIASMVDEMEGELPFVDETTVRLAPNHTVAGNPGRFSTGETTLRPDLEWRERMLPKDRLLTTAITAPLLSRYRYSFHTRGRSAVIR